jgi:hypothetical protein
MDYAQSFILFSGGGRAQLKCWRLVLKLYNSVEGRSTSSGARQDCANELKVDLNLGGKPKASDISQGDTDYLREKVPSLNRPVDSNFPTVKCSHELLCTHMLQYKTKKASKPWKTFEYDPSLETRFMALSSFRATQMNQECDDGIHFIAAACSDGFLRFFKFYEETKNFRILGKTGYHDHCLLCTGHLITGLPLRKVFLLSAGTDGKIVIWDITKTVMVECGKGIDEDVSGTKDGSGDADVGLNGCSSSESIAVFKEPACVIKCHQSGVNAVAVQKLHGKIFYFRILVIDIQAVAYYIHCS